ncbi:MAG TPA: adenylate/guanylate cyclase domain-containing protein [Gaiellaceae bacterium]|nr:adenylate/guanylate cyclase domain-containing protein [Gaiellaceae bacterium]
MNGAHRKVVTVLFCDVVGSTALGESVDPEALQGLLARYFERMKGIVESHGGTVEKFIGDAVMAVFGVPVAHEDDALRACRAAVEMRDALPELGVEGRIGVNTGEVLAGTEERLATGDALNVAARLEQAAQPGEVLIGTQTLALVAPAVEVGEERLLELKGKGEPVAAHPVLAVREAAERSHASRFVGRERELQQLVDAWDRALAGPRCELVTVVGDPGVGKSRLVAEVLARIDARVVRGRCLSYGEGITYWPVIEVVKQLHARPDDEHAAAAIGSLLGEGDTLAATDEIAWGFRKLLEAQAPLVAVFDDIQWAEETFLNLIESTALLSVGASLLLLCMARPELLDRRPGWPAVLRLEPLPEDEAGALVGDEVSDEVREQIVRASGGNPLFLTEMAALGEDAEVPATLRALLAARLDQLDEPERRVLERGAVEGELFHRGTVQALAPEEGEVTPRLTALVRRDLVRPDRPQLPREDAYRFRHLLIRDAAYDALPKATRADLHRRFAYWLEEHGRSLVELDEILGYHLEQAARYLAELGRPDAGLAEEASRRLATAGERARWRADADAAHSLLGRAVRLVEQPDIHLEVAFAMSHVAARDAERLLEEAAGRADDRADAAGAALARGLAAQMRLWTGEGSSDDAEALGLAALPLLEEERDHAGLAQMWFALASGVYNISDRAEQILHAGEMARRYETLIGRPHQRSDGLRAMAHMLGPRPVGESLVALAAFDAAPRVDLARAILLAMSGRIEDARTLARAAAEQARELGQPMPEFVPEIESLSGNHDAAAEALAAWLDWDAEHGLTGNTALTLAWRGRELALAGRYEEADECAAQALEHPTNSPSVEALWRQAVALVHAHRGEHVGAERLAREALVHVQKTDLPMYEGDAHSDLAEVLEAAGHREDAIAAWHEALERYEQKGIVPLVRRVRERLAALQPA